MGTGWCDTRGSRRVTERVRGLLSRRDCQTYNTPIRYTLVISVTLCVTLTFFMYFGSGPSGGWCGGEREDMGDGGQ